MTEKIGTGEEIGTIEVNDDFKIYIKDDGDCDTYVEMTFAWSGGNNCYECVDWPFRKDIGDEQLEEDLEDLEGDFFTSLL